MLFRLVRPVQRRGSRHRYYVRRIPADVKSKAVGLTLSIPLGAEVQAVVISALAQTVRLSLRTNDPAGVKIRMAAVDAYLDKIWQALREDAPVILTNRQATALAGELYRGWANGEGRERIIGVEHDPDFLFPDHTTRVGPDGKLEVTPWRRLKENHVGAAEWEAMAAHWGKMGTTGDSRELEKSLGPIVDRQLLAKGILRVTLETREVVLLAFWQAMRDAFESRKRNAEGDYAHDTKAGRFPEWASAKFVKPSASRQPKVSLKGLVESWWIEASATGRKPSTRESYANTMAGFVAFLAHDDAGRVTRADVVGFKDHRLASVNPRSGKRVSAKTVKDSDLAALKTIFGWAVANGKMDANPAEGVTIKLGRSQKLRSKAFSDAEAEAILKAAQSLQQGQERDKTFAAKRLGAVALRLYGGSRGRTSAAPQGRHSP